MKLFNKILSFFKRKHVQQTPHDATEWCSSVLLPRPHPNTIPKVTLNLSYTDSDKDSVENLEQHFL